MLKTRYKTGFRIEKILEEVENVYNIKDYERCESNAI